MARVYSVQRQTLRVRLPGHTDTRPIVLAPPAQRRQPSARAVVPTQTKTLASVVGVTTGPGTKINMIPADLTQSGRVDITDFIIISLDAGVY